MDSSGNCANSYEYSDFGETTVHGDLYNEICYTGGIYDASTGLYYLNARYYDPADKRFLTEDTYRGSENDPNTLHLYAYCANNPVNYVDPSGHVWETVLDVASIGWSAYDLMNNPSWINFGYLIWDIGATFLPFVPGSYTAKGLKGAKTVKKLSLKVPSTLREVQKEKHLTVGTYKSLKKLYKGAKNRKNIEIHHIIEKRFAKAFNLSPDAFPAVALDKKVHKEITKRFREAWKYNRTRNRDYYNLDKKTLEIIVEKVYKDMPELKAVALKQIQQHAIR